MLAGTTYFVSALPLEMTHTCTLESTIAAHPYRIYSTHSKALSIMMLAVGNGYLANVFQQRSTRIHKARISSFFSRTTSLLPHTPLAWNGYLTSDFQRVRIPTSFLCTIPSRLRAGNEVLVNGVAMYSSWYQAGTRSVGGGKSCGRRMRKCAPYGHELNDVERLGQISVPSKECGGTGREVVREMNVEMRASWTRVHC